MTNKELASKFSLLAKVMDLHGENPFKIRSYSNAYLTLRKFPEELSEKTEKELSEIKGIGKAIASKIRELEDTGEMATLSRYLEKTPAGIQEMLGIKGIGAKKIRTIWKELGIESAGELLYACKENRLVELKGFGLKTQKQIIEQLEYFIESKGLSHYASIIPDAELVLSRLRDEFPEHDFELVGEIARKLPVVSKIELLTNWPESIDLKSILSNIEGLDFDQLNIKIHHTSEKEFITEKILLSSSEQFFEALPVVKNIIAPNEKAFFEAIDSEFIPAELREDPYWLEKGKEKSIPVLIQNEDIKGVVHNHSTFSDGINTVEEMALACMERGYEYFVISDHSKSAFYANGLNEERIHEQHHLIDVLNEKYPDFRIFKSIESDILNDGSLDYDEEILASFDIVIASVHSNLKMDEVKATNRLIKAIENPYTRILGHPTGRLLLARKAYPIDHKSIIDACAENDVVIELNANPYRLDLDWSWIPYALEKNVMISINPDAHSTSGIDDIQWGVAVARKGGLTAKMCLNAKSLEDFNRWVKH